MKKFLSLFLSFFIIFLSCGETLAAASVAATDDDGISLTSLGDYGNFSVAFIDSDSNSTICTMSFDSAYENNSSSLLKSFVGYGFDTIKFFIYLDKPLDLTTYNISFSLLATDLFNQYDFEHSGIVDMSISSYISTNNWDCSMIFSDYSFTHNSSYSRLTFFGTFDYTYSGGVLVVTMYSADTIEISDTDFYVSAIAISNAGDGDLTETNNLISTSNSLLSTVISSISSAISAIKDLPGQIIDLFITAMKSLFIPSDDYFTTKFNELYVLFNEKLGFLMYPTEIFSSFVSALQASSDGFTIEFPAFSLDVGGSSYQVWDKYVFNFDDIKENFPEIFSAAEIIFTVILCGYSINLIITYYDVVVWGSSSTALVDQGEHDDY